MIVLLKSHDRFKTAICDFSSLTFNRYSDNVYHRFSFVKTFYRSFEITFGRWQGKFSFQEMTVLLRSPDCLKLWSAIAAVWYSTKMQVKCIISQSKELLRKSLKMHLHDSNKNLFMLKNLLKSRDWFKTVNCNCSSLIFNKNTGNMCCGKCWTVLEGKDIA